MEQEYQFFNFGPFLMKTWVEESVWSSMTQDIHEVVRTGTDATSQLAGVIEEEYMFDEALGLKYEHLLRPSIVHYVNKLLKQWHVYGEEQLNDPSHVAHKILSSIDNIRLTSMWVNLQKKMEYNPIHHHSGHISFVLYIDVPQVIYSEKSERKSLQNATVYFQDGLENGPEYGNMSDDWTNLKNDLRPRRGSPVFKPVNGELLIFPSYLHHQVQAFKSDVTRVTVSGNWVLP